MYYIIGGDGRTYGPATTEQVQQWIREGRANASTLAQPAGTTEWKPLSAFPEFVAVLGTTVAPPLYRSEQPPVVGLKSKLAAGLLGVFLGAWGIHRFYLGFVGIGIAQIIVTLCTCGLGALWGFIEGILILSGVINTDAQGRPLRD